MTNDARSDRSKWLDLFVAISAFAFWVVIAYALAAAMFGCARPDTIRPHNTLDGIDVQYSVGERFDV